MIRFAQRKGLSSIVGGIFMVLLMAGAVNLTIWSLQQQDNVTSTIISKANSNLNKFNEKISIAGVKITGNKLNVTVSNDGGAASNLQAIYIINQTANQEYRYNLTNSVVDGRTSVTNIGQNIAFTTKAKTNYSIRVVSASGAMASAQLVSVSNTPLQMSAYLIPPTATTGSNVTLMFTVTNNSTSTGLTDTITPVIQTSLSCVVGPGCSLTQKVTPVGGIYLGSGATAVFKSVYYVAAPDKTSMTFNASISNAAIGNYVIEKGRVQLINATETSFYADITNQTRLVLSQSIGSFQIDFKSLGMIRYPSSPTISGDGVPQDGWQVNFTSVGGRGYPAFYIPDNEGTILTVKMRNADPSGQNLTLYQGTGLTFSLAGQNNNQSPPAYICYVDEKTNTIHPYSEKTQYKQIIPNALKFGSNYTEGWVNIYFCTSTPGSTTAWNPGTCCQFSGITPVFMIVRGAFTNIYTEYGQTLPYQAVTLTSSTFLACLNWPTSACGTNDHYKVSRNDQDSLRISGGAGSPYNTTAIWINPDGSTIPLGVNMTTNPFTITIPSSAVSGKYYAIQVYDTANNIYSMTVLIK